MELWGSFELQPDVGAELGGEHLEGDQASAADRFRVGVGGRALEHEAGDLARADPAQRTGGLDGIRFESSDGNTHRERRDGMAEGRIEHGDSAWGGVERHVWRYPRGTEGEGVGSGRKMRRPSGTMSYS
jgi:hypothetical protein